MWTAQQDIQLIELIKDLRPLTEMSRLFGISRQALHQHIYKNKKLLKLWLNTQVDRTKASRIKDRKIKNIEVSKRMKEEITKGYYMRYYDLKSEEYDSMSIQELHDYRIRQRFWRAKIKRCKKDNVIFNVPFNSIKWPKNCPILGYELRYGLAFDKKSCPSFDKIIPEKGYVEGNVKIISYHANFLKNNATASELKTILNYIEKSTPKFYFHPLNRNKRGKG